MECTDDTVSEGKEKNGKEKNTKKEQVKVEEEPKIRWKASERQLEHGYDECEQDTRLFP